MVNPLLLRSILYLCSIRSSFPKSCTAGAMLDKINLPKPVWIVFGFIFSGIGIAGFVLPMMPGLVFFILASFCFAKSSPRLLKKILSHPVIGPQIMDWKRGKGMRIKTKVLAIILVTLSLTFSIFYMVDLVWVKWIIFFSMLGINAYILSVKTRKPSPSILALPKNPAYDSVKSGKNSKEILSTDQVNAPGRK
ncbi:MAG: YbaN family protein [Bacteroidia bacterium]|nr:YbaN family protein [Bacteroidia bacterium]